MTFCKRNQQLTTCRPRRLGLATPRRARRGVLLLVILSMLIVFLMTAVAYVVVARHFDRSSKATSDISKLDEPAQELLDGALYDILRDTRNPHSRVRYHSLLQDMYGTDGFMGEVFAPPNGHPDFQALIAKFPGAAPAASGNAGLIGETSGQILQFAADNWTDLFGVLYAPPNLLPAVDNYFNGHVLTWTSGPLAGESMRVVGYRYDPTHPGGAVHQQRPFIHVLATGSQARQLLTPATTDNSEDPERRPRSPEIKELVNVPSGSGGNLRGHRFVINGRPFNGTGAGYDISGRFPNVAAPPGSPENMRARLDFAGPSPPGLATAGIPYLLAPNPAFFDRHQDEQNTPPTNSNSLAWAYPTFPGRGDSDEGYDAADYQNMLLALVPMNPTIPSGLAESGGSGPAYLTLADPSETDRIVQPSLHRRELINYWIKTQNPQFQYIGDANARWQAWHVPDDAFRSNPSAEAFAEKALARKVVLRPLPFDHPNFPQIANLMYGPWDVDNDGDGVPDSIWVDLGYPPVKNADGRYYKPMFAILVQDLDGRLNLNAHGSREEAVRGRPQHEHNESDKRGVVLASPDTTVPSPQFQFALQLPPGQGYGTAEISLLPLLAAASGGNAQAQYQRLLRGTTINDQFIPGRYGVNPLPGAGQNRWDLLAQMKFREYPMSYDRFQYQGGQAATNFFNQRIRRGFNSPPDLKGRFGLGVDFTGFPNFIGFFDQGETMLAESAYEKNLLAEGPRTVLAGRDAAESLAVGDDTLFTVAELERLLRRFDADVGQLPDRLTTLASGLFDAARAVTTRSVDVPVPSILASPEQHEKVLSIPRLPAGQKVIGTRPSNVIDLLRTRLLQEPTRIDLDRLSDAERQRYVRTLLSADLADNLRLDINRPFGNGRDDDLDGAVDDPEEARSLKEVWRGPLRAGTAAQAVSADSGDVYANIDGTNDRRVDVARKDNDEVAALDGNPGDLTTEEWQFAQGNARQFMARDLFVLAMLLKDDDYYFEFGDEQIDNHNPMSPDPGDEKFMTIRRLAQWAVNVVDFRDADAIMTGFEVDIRPFTDDDGDPSNGTWDVDGDLATVEPDATDGFTFRHVMWGLERPQALITETLATHDLRVIDSNKDTSGKFRDDNNSGDFDDPDEDDEDLDQFRIPQGSLFIELFCTGNPTNNVQPGELYEYDSTLRKWLLDLGRRPRIPGTTNEDPNPVWRLAISDSHVPGRYGDERDTSVYERFLQNPETISFQPENMNLMIDEPGGPVEDYRYVWFASGFDPENPDPRVPEPDRIFWNTGGFPAAVPAGQYAVAGPRPITTFGSEGTGLNREPAGQSIELNTGSIIVNDDTRNVQTPYTFDTTGDSKGHVKAAYGIVIGMEKDLPGWSRPADIGLNISEPLPGVTGQYYREPTEKLSNYPEMDAYADEQNAAPPFPDQPFDLRDGTPIRELGRLIGTHENVRTVFLQRLADPTMPWNPAPEDPKFGTTGTLGDYHLPDMPVNPYITVDWQPLDLTVFNGEDPGPPSDWEEEIDDNRESMWVSQEMDNDAPYETRFSTRERGLVEAGGNIIGGGGGDSGLADNIWRAESNRHLRSSARQGNMMAHFKYALHHSLGYVNETYGVPVQLPADLRAYQAPIKAPTTPNARALALGAPAVPNTDPMLPPIPKPFPWLAWNDRPFISQYELLQVPISAPSRLTVEHSTATPDTSFDPYDPEEYVSEFVGEDGEQVDPADGPQERFRYSNPNSTFGHLLNFQAATEPPAPGDPPKPAPNFHRLLEYLGVPSRFVGTETFLNPEVFSQQVASTELRRPPFNRISQYREPGRVNLNTISSELVYYGLFGGDPTTAGVPGTSPPVHPGPELEEFVISRRGYRMANPDLNDKMLALHDDYPTFFAGHFGPPEAGHLVPLADDTMGAESDELDGLTDMRRRGSDMGLLRRDIVHGPEKPLFRDHAADTNPNVATNPHKHSHFHYQPAQRLANLTTSRSNVYAAWMTVGFFEMEPVPEQHRRVMIENHPDGPAAGQALYDRLYPEGMWLGQEAGSDIGQTKRYRGFYIIDRSVPVAYEPGKNHNVQDAVILRRRIE